MTPVAVRGERGSAMPVMLAVVALAMSLAVGHGAAGCRGGGEGPGGVRRRHRRPRGGRRARTG